MLKGLIKPDLKSREAADRLTAIEKMSDPDQHQSELATLVQNDSDAAVRMAALAKVTDLQKLADLVVGLIDTAQTTDVAAVPDTLNNALQKQFGSSLQLPQGQLPADGINALMERSPECRHLVACASPDEAVRTSALAGIDSEESLVRVVAEAQHHSARLAAAERLQQPEQMQACLTRIKNRDKVTARLLQQRLSEYHAGIEKTELHQASVRQITASMQTLSGSVWSPQYAGQFVALQQRWNALDPVPGEAEQQAYRDASQSASEKVAEHKSQLQQLDACQQTLTDIDAAIEKLASSDLANLAEISKSMRQTADSIPQQWHQASEALSIENSLQPAYDTALKKLEGLLHHAQAIVKADAVEQAPAVEGKESEQLQESKQSSETATAAEPESLAPTDNPDQTAAVQVDSPETVADEKSATDATAAEKENANNQAEQKKQASQKAAADSRRTSPVKRRKVIDAALSDEHFAATMKCVPELHQRLESLSQLLEKDQHRQAQLVEGIGKQLGALSSTIAAGKWGTAEGMSNRIARKLEQVEGKERQPLQSRYDTQRKKLDELADWQDFAAKPKLEVLVKTMQELPAQSMKPRELADEVKSLQQQWKEFGGCRVANQLWPEFKEAGDTAYAPCKEYFDGLKKQREARIKNRHGVCQRLETFVAENAPSDDAAAAIPAADLPESDAEAETTENAVTDVPMAEPVGDWKAMQRMLSDAQREWRNNRITGRKQDKQLETRFNKAVQQIEQLITPHFASGEAERQEIIEKTRKLSENDINQHVINQAKSLQAAWKVCGPASRKNDRKLWTEFNDLCGQIFNKHREDQRAQYKAGMAHVDRGRDIVKTIRALGKKSSDHEDKQFQELQDEFQGLAEFPEKVRKGLLRDFRNACDGYNTKRSNFGKKQEREELDALRKMALVCEQIENGVIDYRDFKESEVTESAAEPAVDASVEATADAATEVVAEDAAATDAEAVTDAPVAQAKPQSASTDAEGWLEQWQELADVLPKPWLKRIKKRRDSALSVMEKQDSPFSDKNNDARRLHCIKLEILRDVDTPAEDKALRMQYQLEQLQSGPDSAFKDAGKEQLRAYEVDWLCLPPAATEIAATLEQRFRKALGQ